MAISLSRQALYDLVWTRPRSDLAKEFGVSDVAISKHCARENIPAPPPGYWSKVKNGRKLGRTPLPMRLPGQSGWVDIGQQDRSYWRRVRRSSEPLEPPTFVEDIDKQVEIASAAIGNVARTRDLGSADPALSKILASEAKRRAKSSKWSFEQPLFDSPVHQRQLRLFNSLARALRPLYGAQHVASEDEWIRNVCTVHHLRLHLSIGAVSMSLGFHEPTDDKRLQGWIPVKATTLQVGDKNSYGGIKQWADSDECKLEQQLTGIVRYLLRRAEESLRASAQQQYEYRIKELEERRLQEVARLQAEEENRQAALAAKLAKIRDEIVELSRLRSVAMEIRTTVEALRFHPEAQGADAEVFSQWVTHALSVADAMDPMNAPIRQILGSFDAGTSQTARP